MAANKRKTDDDTVSEKTSRLAWVGACVRVCLCLRARICANMGGAV